MSLEAIAARRSELMRMLGDVAGELDELAHREGAVRAEAGVRDVPSVAAMEAHRLVRMIDGFTSVPFRRGAVGASR